MIALGCVEKYTREVHQGEVLGKYTREARDHLILILVLIPENSDPP